MNTLERRCTCNRLVCYLCQLDRVEAEARGLTLNLTPPEEWEVVAYYDGGDEEVVEAGLDESDAWQTSVVMNHDGHAGVTYAMRRSAPPSPADPR